ncbi:MAG: 3-hydroxyacyl-CoA dehydrogenase NAD-binding domain-containing protein [Spirochaetia bacterium]|jgi:3-hydroxyacyl-CoA dehydrogenase/enoyl-CoA hydratase/3-hydroxybutyryl-CoA epimerase
MMGDEVRSRTPAPVFTLSVRDGVAQAVLDIPGEKVNVLSDRVMQELDRLLAELKQRGDVRCLVLKSGKPGIFIAGVDLHDLSKVTDVKSAAEKSRQGQELFNTIDDLPFPTVALIDGAAAGGGLELALACDYRIVTDNPKTKLSLPETQRGIIPGFGGTYRLPRTVGLSQALRMILTGMPVDGIRAVKIGLADACYPSAFLEDKAAAFVQGVVGSPRAPRAHRRRRPLGRALAEGSPVGRALLFRAAAKEIDQRVSMSFPAPREALKVLRRTVHASRGKALGIEREAISRLLPTDMTRNLVRLFFAQEAAKHAAAQGAGEHQVGRAAVLGAGVMGGKIAWLFASSGIPVVMKDIAWDAVRKGFTSAHEIYQELQKRKRLAAREVTLGMHRLSGAVDYRSLGSPDVVLEAVVENLAVKKAVLAEVEGKVSEDVLLASNTSSLSITEMSSALKRPERFVGMHFFNPPNRMPLVEIIAGARTSPAAVSAAGRLARTLGKTPIVVKDCPGFLVNRLLMPYLNESVRLLQEGCDFPTVDRLLVDWGMPMGPFTLLDEIGIDIAVEVGRVLSAAYGERMAAADFFADIDGRKDLRGRKSGKGFYLHAGRKRTPNTEMQRLAAASASSAGRKPAPAPPDILARLMYSMVNEAARALQEGVVSSAQDLDLALILGIGFPPYRGGLLRYAESVGLPQVRDTLARYARELGSRFAPAPLLARLAEEKGTFYTEG